MRVEEYKSILTFNVLHFFMLKGLNESERPGVNITTEALLALSDRSTDSARMKEVGDLLMELHNSGHLWLQINRDIIPISEGYIRMNCNEITITPEGYSFFMEYLRYQYTYHNETPMLDIPDFLSVMKVKNKKLREDFCSWLDIVK